MQDLHLIFPLSLECTTLFKSFKPVKSRYWTTSKWAESPRGNGKQKSDSIEMFPSFLKAVYATACKTKIWMVSSKNKSFEHNVGLSFTREQVTSTIAAISPYKYIFLDLC